MGQGRACVSSGLSWHLACSSLGLGLMSLPTCVFEAPLSVLHPFTLLCTRSGHEMRLDWISLEGEGARSRAPFWGPQSWVRASE